MRRTISLFLVAFMALGTGLAFAEQHGVDREDRDGLTGNLYRLSEIEDFGIMSDADEQIGNVDEAVMSLEGQVTHLIVDLDDLEGLEGGRYLVPLDSIWIYDTENVTLDLQRAQEFQRYDDDPAVAEGPEQRAHQLPEGTVRSSEFLGYDVVGPRDDRIASVEDVVVDLETGQVVYVAIASGGFLGIGREYYAVSFDQLQVVVADEEIRLDITEDDLERVEGFDTDNWPAEGQDLAMVGVEDRDVAEDREVEEDRDGLTGNLYRISEIEDFGIMGDADEQIGNVNEAVLSLEGQVTHLIVDLDDLQDLHGTYLVPMDAVSLYDTENIRLDVQRAQEFARFDDDQAAWDDDPETARAQHLPEGTVRSSEFLRYDVVGPRDDVIASTEDLVVDLETGHVVYVAIASGGFLGIGREYYAISFDRMQIEVAEERVRIDMTEEDLQQLEGFDTDQWPREGQAVGA